VRLALALTLAGSLASADEGAEMGRRVQDLLHAHQADVFACVQAAKKEADGELLLRVFVGDDGKAARVDVLKDRSSLGGCVADKIRAWDLSPLQASSGDQLVFPLAFHADNPYLVHAELPKGDAKIIPVVLWSGGKASLTLLKLAPSVRLAAHTHPSAEAVYVVKGILRVRQPGRPQESLKAGDAAFFAAGEPHSLEAAPLAPTELLQVFSPAGPEAAYGDHAAGGTTPSKQAASKPAWLAMATKSLPIPTGAIRLLLDGSGAPFALDELSANPGAVPPHKHEGSDELLYILDGKGTTTISGKSFAMSAGDSLRIPAGLEHSLTVDEKLTAVQVYAPAGPEQRFKK
jgi:quercetin dioxygenase-like cupin family protein